MPKFAANLSFLFSELPFEQRFQAAATAGFEGVEYLFPYDWPAAQVADWLARAGLTQVLFNLSPGDWTAGDRGLACLPDRKAAFVDSVEQALAYAEVLDCSRLHCMAGLTPSGIEAAELIETYVGNLRFAADRCAAYGITLLIEPINSRIDMPGYWLDSIAKAADMLARIDHDNVRLQLDLYHAQVMQGDLARCIEAHLPVIGHIQIADNPGRHEPGSGEINYPYLFALLDRLGYAGWVGCEYRPSTTTLASLGWREAVLK